MSFRLRKTSGDRLKSLMTRCVGNNLVNIFFIVDEAQNLTPHEVKTIITRAGEGTKIVFTVFSNRSLTYLLVNRSESTISPSSFKLSVVISLKGMAYSLPDWTAGINLEVPAFRYDATL